MRNEVQGQLILPAACRLQSGCVTMKSLVQLATHTPDLRLSPAKKALDVNVPTYHDVGDSTIPSHSIEA